MKELVEVGVLTEEEIEEVIAAKFNPVKFLFSKRRLDALLKSMMPKVLLNKCRTDVDSRILVIYGLKIFLTLAFRESYLLLFPTYKG